MRNLGVKLVTLTARRWGRWLLAMAPRAGLGCWRGGRGPQTGPSRPLSTQPLRFLTRNGWCCAGPRRAACCRAAAVLPRLHCLTDAHLGRPTTPVPRARALVPPGGRSRPLEALGLLQPARAHGGELPRLLPHPAPLPTPLTPTRGAQNGGPGPTPHPTWRARWRVYIPPRVARPGGGQRS